MGGVDIFEVCPRVVYAHGRLVLVPPFPTIKQTVNHRNKTILTEFQTNVTCMNKNQKRAQSKDGYSARETQRDRATQTTTDWVFKPRERGCDWVRETGVGVSSD